VGHDICIWLLLFYYFSVSFWRTRKKVIVITSPLCPWAYFADENCTEKRVFKTDYELYLGESEAEIYIGVE